MAPNELFQLQQIASQVAIPFWARADFWISTILGLAGLRLSFMAFREASQARAAAVEAGRNVKVQTVAIELSEVSQRLDSIESTISFTEARNLLAEISRKLRRVTSPFADDTRLSAAITALRDALDVAQESLKSVRPTLSAESEQPTHVVYYGIENDFSNINNLIADLIGLLEKGTIGLEGKNVDA